VRGGVGGGGMSGGEGCGDAGGGRGRLGAPWSRGGGGMIQIILFIGFE
jgi:hypothetical protein